MVEEFLTGMFFPMKAICIGGKTIQLDCGVDFETYSKKFGPLWRDLCQQVMSPCCHGE